MSKNGIEALTFDLWDTLFVDDSDEAKRTRMGLDSKIVTRRKMLHEYLVRHEPIPYDMVAVSYGAADAAFGVVWHDLHVTWSVRQRISIVLRGLDRTLPEEELAELTKKTESMEIEVSPDVVEGAAEALAALSERYRMAVISDAIFSPGWALKKLLEVHGLARYFDAFVFSDEIGVSKPHPKVFEKAAQSLGVATDRLCHIGDREHNDVDGAHRVSAKAVLFTGAKDRGSSTSRAEAVCGDLRELVDILEGVD